MGSWVGFTCLFFVFGFCGLLFTSVGFKFSFSSFYHEIVCIPCLSAGVMVASIARNGYFIN
jgi:hypothetical protein